MNKLLISLKGELNRLIESLDQIPTAEALNIAHGNWSFPGVSKDDLEADVSSLINLIDLEGREDLSGYEEDIGNYISRVVFLREHTVPQIWGNPAAGVSAFNGTIRVLGEFLRNNVFLPEDKDEALRRIRKIAAQVRAMEARLKDLEPRSREVSEKIAFIESVHDIAHELPADIEQLKEDRLSVKRLLSDTTIEASKVSELRGKSEGDTSRLSDIISEADGVLARCEEAYSSATSVGLAAAFSERSEALNSTVWKWVAGLIIALGLGGYFGSLQLKSLMSIAADPSVNESLIFINLTLALLSVGGPVWFAWLCTKQIGQRFRLSEDYAFKASISRAYEGYRREAAKIDPALEAKLLESALTRLDEIPLRLVEPATHGSPWHELISSDLVKEAIKSVPGFVDSVKGMAGSMLSKSSSRQLDKQSSPSDG